MDANTIEIVRFKLKPGVDLNNFIEENKKVEKNLIMKMPGILSRETARNEQGEVVVVLHWARPEDAQNSMDKFVAAAESKDFTALIDMDTFSMTRFVKL
jgi:heme-degrading monooxygenase HmoA